MARFQVVALALLVAGISAVEVTPIQRVLQMMEELRAKANQEKDQEVVDHTTYMQFCKSTAASKADAIAAGKDKIERLSSDIDSYNSDASVLAEDISELDANLDKTQQELAKAQEQRDVQKADYTAARADLTNSITQMEESMTKLNGMKEDVDATSLVQSIAQKPKIPASARRTLMSFLETSSSSASLAPEGATYESQSGGIIDMVGDLKGKMEKERNGLDKDEAKEVAAFTLVKQKLGDMIDQHSTMRDMKATNMKEKETNSAAASADKADTAQNLDEDTKYLADLKVTCEQQATTFAARQKLRQEEIEAIEKAMEIIGGDSVSGAGEKHLPSLAQEAASFVQLRSTAKATGQSAAAAFLAAQSRKLSSKMLGLVAQRASFDPFEKVRKMIREMIQKLEEEGGAEAEHKAFCDKELGSNKATRDEKTSLVEQLTAQTEEMNAKSAGLADEMADLNAQISELDAAVKKATEIRTSEKAKNTQTVQEAEQAVVAVQKALSVLKEFYEKAAASTSLIEFMKSMQTPPKALDSKPFTGTGGEGGILGMLEVILSDFQRLLSETTSDESAAEMEYEKFTADSKEDRDTKDRSVRQKTDAKQYLDVDIGETKQDLKSEQKELDAAMKYFEELKPSCLETGVSAEDRIAKREEEIQSLNEALKILSGDM